MIIIIDKIDYWIEIDCIKSTVTMATIIFINYIVKLIVTMAMHCKDG